MSASHNSEEHRALEQLGELKTSLLHPLRNLLINLIREAQDECDKDLNVVFCWDWDMIFNYMYQDSPREIFAGALSAMLELEKDGDAMIAVPDGARKEMRRYLAEKARRYRNSRLYVESSTDHSRSRIAQRAREGDNSWSPIEKNIEVLMDHKSIRRLDEFLCGHSMMIEAVSPQSSSLQGSKKTPVYSKTLQVLSARHGSRRNQADALNVAQVSLAQSEGRPSRLVTGTNQLLASFPELTTDPFTSLVSTLVHANIPGHELRARTLNRWLAKVAEIIDKCSVVQEAFEGSAKPLTPRRVKALTSTISVIQEEPVLLQLSEILCNATLISKSRAEQLSSGRKDIFEVVGRLPSSSLKSVEAAINRLLDKTNSGDQSDLISIGINWRENKRTAHYESWALFRTSHGGNGQDILTIELSRERYSIRWSVELSLGEFLLHVENTIKRKWVPRPRVLLFEVLFDGARVERAEIPAVNKRWSLRGGISISEEEKISRVRILTDRAAIYYEPGSLDLERGPIIAVVDNDPNFRWALSLSGETALEYVPPSTLKRELVQRFNLFLGSQNDKPQGDQGIAAAR